MKADITKAIIPVAGLGTRLRPLTYHQPKGMVGVADKPIIHYLIDELVAEGIRHIIFIISGGQSQFQTYIDSLQADSEWVKLGVKFEFAMQNELKGSADALLSIEDKLKDEPFFVYFGDDLLAGKVSPAKIFIDCYKKTKAPILILEHVAPHLIEKYGIVRPQEISEGFYKILNIIEKPKKEDAPSDMGAMGRYILTTDIFAWIHKAKTTLADKKEIAIADVLGIYVKEGGELYGWLFEGEHFDAGSKLGLLQAQVYYGLQHPELKEEFQKFLKKIAK